LKSDIEESPKRFLKRCANKHGASHYIYVESEKEYKKSHKSWIKINLYGLYDFKTNNKTK